MTDEVYEYLIKPRKIRKEIEVLKARQDAIRNKLLPSGIAYDSTPVLSSKGDPMSLNIAKVVDIDTRVKELRLELQIHVVDMEQKFSLLPKNDEYTVMYLYYIGDRRVPFIADKLGYSKATVYRIRGNGCRHLSEILKNETNEKMKSIK